MSRYVASVIRSKRGQGPEPPPVLEAALETLGWYHARLLGLRPGPIETELAYGLTVKRDWALYALIDHGGKGWAKQQQLDITAGRPLAICTGGGYEWFVETKLGTLRAWKTGCFQIFEEPANIRGRKWGRLCPDCRMRHRHPYRDAERQLRKRVENYLDSRDRNRT